MILAGVASCVRPLGIIGISRETSAAMYRGVVEVRHIMAYLDPIRIGSPADWHDPVNHPERILPPRPTFPWFGLSPVYQVGLFNLPDDRSMLTPACTRTASFPIWVPALLLCAPYLWLLRTSRQNRSTAQGGIASTVFAGSLSGRVEV